MARGVREAFGFRKGSQEESELESAAYLELVRKARQFRPELVPPGGDPGGAFRGWCHASVLGECKREARRLRNGGTYRTRREGRRRAIEVRHASDLAGRDGAPFDPVDPSTVPDPACADDHDE